MTIIFHCNFPFQNYASNTRFLKMRIRLCGNCALIAIEHALAHLQHEQIALISLAHRTKGSDNNKHRAAGKSTKSREAILHQRRLTANEFHFAPVRDCVNSPNICISLHLHRASIRPVPFSRLLLRMHKHTCAHARPHRRDES
jgi:hypothetical protein